jgi:parallel beta-helix repeat protein
MCRAHFNTEERNMEEKKADGSGNIGEDSRSGTLSRRDFGKLSLGTLGAILPGTNLIAAEAKLLLPDRGGTGVFVSPDGSDRNPGTKPRPFATLERARDSIRTLKRSRGLPWGGATVWLRGGTYRLRETFKLGVHDSGTDGAPIVYRAYPHEKVAIIGGKRLSGFTRLRNAEVLRRIDRPYRDKIRQLDLNRTGITNFGKLAPRGFGLPIHPAALELFFQDRPMTLARWPNAGWEKVGTSPAGGDDDSFAYTGDRPLRWCQDDDVWVHGYWNWDWADSYLKIRSIHPQEKRTTIYPADGIRGNGFKPGQRYYALNILEELDAPGEWYLDRRSGILYFWPPEPLERGKAFVSLLEQPLVEIQDASHLVFRDLAFKYTRGSAVEVSGGRKNLIAGCVFRNIGTFAVKIAGGTANGVVGCDISETGEGAIILSGGDRQTLTPAGNYATNNQIDRYSRWVRTYRPAVSLEGVGNRVAHNLIYHAPHCGILLSGNNHVVEFNEIHHVALETSDVGAIYMGRNYTMRGNIIRFNYIHDLPVKGWISAVYLDDCWSGTTVYGNVFYRAHRGIMLGGGRDNTLANNIFVECRPGIYLDARGLTWARFWFDGRDPTLMDRLKEVQYKKPPYSVQYPRLVDLLQDEPTLPKGNAIVRNVCYGGRWLDLIDNVSAKVIRMEGNYIGLQPGFVDLAGKDFRLREDSPAIKLGFKRIPMEKIGLYSDEYRTDSVSRSFEPSGQSFDRS